MDNLTPTKIQLSIQEMFKQAWGLISGIKMQVLGYMLLAYLVSLAVILGIGIIHPSLLKSMTTHDTQPVFSVAHLIVSIITYAVLWFFFGAALLVGAKRALGITSTQPSIMKVLFSVAPQLAVISIAYACIAAGMMQVITVIPKEQVGLYTLANIGLIFISFLFNIVAHFATILIAVFKIPFMLALRAGFHGLWTNFTKIFLTSLLMQCALIISIIPFGIGLIWAFPLLWVLEGILFRETFTAFTDKNISDDTTHVVA